MCVHLDFNKTPGEKAWKELHKGAEFCFEQHPTKQHLYSHLPPILQTIQVRQARLV